MTTEKKSLLIELGVEELPPGSLLELSGSFSKGIFSKIKEAGLVTGDDHESFATPRRLAVLIKNVDGKQKDWVSERVGPPVSRATDESGTPNKIGLGFAKSVGVALS